MAEQAGLTVFVNPLCPLELTVGGWSSLGMGLMAVKPGEQAFTYQCLDNFTYL